MSYKLNEPNTRKQIARFSVDEWISFRERLNEILMNESIKERDKQILKALIVDMRSTAELAYLAKTDNTFSWLKSNQGKPMSVRRIQQILTDYFPEFHIQTTHKKNKPSQQIRTEQNNIRKTMITDESVCGKCGTKANLEIHHMFPVILGGDNDERNLLILCEECHQETTNYIREKLNKIKSS